MERFDDFLQERRYLIGVSEKTLAYYRWAFASWTKHSDGDPKTWLIKLRGLGIAATSCNTYICALNTYWQWAGEYNPVTTEGRHLAYLKEEQKLLQVFKPEHVPAIIEFKSKKYWEHRCHTLCCVLFDCSRCTARARRQT